MTSLETSFTALLVAGVAQLLAADPGSDFVWNLDGVYAATDTGIGVMAFPLLLNRAVAISPYPLTAHPTLAQSEIGVQIKTRGASQDPFEVMAMDDQVQAVLLGRFPMVLPTGLRVSSLVWTSGGSLGVDDNNRWNWSSNFTADLNRPSPHRQ